MIAKLAFRSLAIAFLFGGSIYLMASGNFVAGMIIHLSLVGYLLSGTLNPSSRLFGPIQTSCENDIWITLDDGPDPSDTPAILDLLDRHGAKATFFVIGKKAAQHPDLIREIIRRGHQLGNHTWSHPQASFWMHGPLRIYREIEKCQKILTQITGEPPRYFRAPVGHFNVFVHPILRHFGMRLIGWSSRGFDAVDTSLERVTEKIRASAKPGAIILAHEATPIAQEVVADILKIAQENGWKCTIPPALPKSDSC